jgi:hypothetical protein
MIRITINARPMVVNRASRNQPQGLPALHVLRRKKKNFAVLLALTGAAMTLVQYDARYFNKRPIHTSVLTGQRWLDELLEGEQDNRDHLNLSYMARYQATQFDFAGSLAWSDLSFVTCCVNFSGDAVFETPDMSQLRSSWQYFSG